MSPALRVAHKATEHLVSPKPLLQPLKDPTWIHRGSHGGAGGHRPCLLHVNTGLGPGHLVLLLPPAGQHQGVAGGRQRRMQAQGVSEVQG